MHWFASRTVAGLGAVAMIVSVCGGCASTPSASSAPSTTAARADCVVHGSGSSSIDGLFGDIPGFSVDQGCPPGAQSPFAGASVTDASAATVSDNGSSVLTAFAAQLTTATGEAFAESYVAEMARSVTDPNRAVASDTQMLGGRQVTHYYSPDSGEGYTYGQGSTVIIARVAPGSPVNAAKAAVTGILNNLH